jgi:hypothetical protein
MTATTQEISDFRIQGLPEPDLRIFFAILRKHPLKKAREPRCHETIGAAKGKTTRGYGRKPHLVRPPICAATKTP